MEEIGGIVGSVASHMGQTLKHEAKKMAKSAGGHITGQGAGGPTPTSDAGGRAIEEARKKQAQRHYSFTPKQEVKRFAEILGSQLTGRLPTALEISEMNDKDQNLSQKDYEIVHQKILKMYRDHEEKRKKEREQAAQQLAIINERKKESQEAMRWKIGVRGEDKNPAIAKTRAEVGKNFGAE